MIGALNSGFVAEPSLNKIKNEDKKPQATNTTQSADKNDKLSEISKSIANGTYKIDLDKIAQAIAGELF